MLTLFLMMIYIYFHVLIAKFIIKISDLEEKNIEMIVISMFVFEASIFLAVYNIVFCSNGYSILSNSTSSLSHTICI